MTNEIYRSEKCLTTLETFQRSSEVIEGWKACLLSLNSLTFGYANQTIWHFRIQYEPSNTFNCEIPQCSTHVATLRSAFYKKDFERATPRFIRRLESWHKRLSWDLPAPSLTDHYENWIHPDEDRGFQAEELRLIAGTHPIKSPPEKVLEFVQRQIQFYEEGAWGSEDFCGWWDHFRHDGKHWREYDSRGKALKTFDFQLLYSELYHPLSAYKL